MLFGSHAKHGLYPVLICFLQKDPKLLHLLLTTTKCNFQMLMKNVQTNFSDQTQNSNSFQEAFRFCIQHNDVTLLKVFYEHSHNLDGEKKVSLKQLMIKSDDIYTLFQIILDRALMNDDYNHHLDFVFNSETS
mmetsp:Transcript_1254/g.1287  ORF Transcript_1254/g.1287 Transcript_1254/m.1287 type:complete len:133 (+) Transcript_1254:1314-1712(+)